MADGSVMDKFGVDVEALREKYREERNKRLRSDGDDQYAELACAQTGDLALALVGTLAVERR